MPIENGRKWSETVIWLLRMGLLIDMAVDRLESIQCALDSALIVF